MAHNRETEYCEIHDGLVTGSDGLDIVLDRQHLVNYISFEGYPSHSSEDQFKWYSYKVIVSLDGNQYTGKWLELFNYNLKCRGQQELHFPTISVRYIYMH